MSPILTATNISKEFTTSKPSGLFKRSTKTTTALSNISFTIEKPTVLAVIGANGAGKTTLLKLLLGLVEPTNGSIELLGFNPYTDRKKIINQLGFVSGQKRMLNPDLTAYDYISVSSLFYGLAPEEIEKRLLHLSELFEVTHRLHSLVRSLSLGETIKFEIIASIIHKPQVLFLDEPTIGLDFSSQSTIVSLLKQYHEQEGVTILLTSHYAKDIQTLSKELLVIEKGAEVYYDSLENLNSHPNRKVNTYLQTLNEELARYA